jgi:DNA polymerase-3 subunit alpha
MCDKSGEAKGGYVSLHNHTHYSLLDALSRPEEAIKRIVELGQTAYSMTDHGNMFGAVKVYEECVKNGIKPIIGCEFYFTNEHTEKERKSRHITLIAQNNVGLSNLYKMTTWANVPVDRNGGFFYRPRVSWKELEKYSEGILCLTGCMNSPSNHAFVHDGYLEGKDHVKHMASIFGKDRTFVELQNVNDPDKIYIPEQKLILDNCRQVAEELSLRSVATNDGHYILDTDSFAHEVLKAIDARATLKTPVVDHSKGQTKGRLVFNGFDYYMRSKDQMLEKFTEAEVQASQDIADSIDISMDLGGMKTPKYKGMTDAECMKALKSACELSWNDMGIGDLDNKSEYISRIRREFEEIEDANLQHYFMIVFNVCKFCDDNDILRGFGRGSCAGSLALYLLGVTQYADPIKYGLLWERFWNHGRKGSMPDVDLDIQIDRRDEVLQYLKDEFGNDRVLPMMTLNTLSARGVIKDVGKVMGLTHEYLNKLTKSVPDKNNGLQDSIDRVKVLSNASKGVDEDTVNWKKEAEKDPSKARLMKSQISERRKALLDTFEIAKKLENVNRNRSTHACAVLISDKSIFGVIPCCWDANKKALLTGFDMYDIEKLGYMKLDLLGLKTLSVVSRTMPNFKEVVGEFDDQDVYRSICRGNNKGIFQLESKLGENWAKKVKPRNIEELAALVSLIRPAVLESGLADQYLRNKISGEWTTIHPELEPIFKETYGVMLYQEQMLEVVKVFGGFDLKEADMLRKAIGKKIPKLMASFRKRFLDGCIAKHKNAPLAEELWSWIEKGAEYGFNKSHALTYGMMAYTTAYAKFYHPQKFYCSLLQLSENEQRPQDEISEIFYDAKLRKISIKPPSLVHSEDDFTISGDHIYFGLKSIKKVGKASVKTVNKIYEESSDTEEFLLGLRGAKKDVAEALAYSGALDFLEIERVKLHSTVALLKALTDKEFKVFSVIAKGGGDVDLSTARTNKVVEAPKSDGVFDAVEVFRKWLNTENILAKVVNSKRVEKVNSLFDTLDELNNSEDKYRYMAARELLYVGVPLKYCEVDIYEDNRSTHSVINIKHEIPKRRFSTIAIITRVAPKTDRKGNKMAFLKISDKTFSMDAIIFSDAFSKFKSNIKEGNICFIEGMVSRDGAPLIESVQGL